MSFDKAKQFFDCQCLIKILKMKKHLLLALFLSFL